MSYNRTNVKVAKGSLRNIRQPQNSSSSYNNNNNNGNLSNLSSSNTSNTSNTSSSNTISFGSSGSTSAPSSSSGGGALGQLSQDTWIRKQWKVGSKVEVYSNSAKKWFEGDITRIFFDAEGEWLEVQYACGKVMRLKQIPRDDKDAIRPLPKSMPIYTQQSASNNDQQLNDPNKAMFQPYRAPQGSFAKNTSSLSATATISS